MKLSKKWIYGLCIAILLFILFIVGFFWYSTRDIKEDDATIVKENVKVITADMDSGKQPESVMSDRLVFAVDPEYKKGDVIVAGSIYNAENGFIRRVTEVKEVEDKYVIYTEPAVLTDVFEKAHIVKRIHLMEDAATGGHYNSENYVAVQNDTKIQNMVMEKNSNYTIENLKKEEFIDESEYLFGTTFEIGEGATKLEGDMGVDIWLELQIDIEDGEIECSMTIKKESGVNVNLHSGADAEKKINKKIYTKKLPNYEFFVSFVPIVITNQMELIAELETKLEGDIGLSYEITYENTLGFQYSSKTGKVSSINEKESDSDGIEWNTIRVQGSASGEVGLHYVSKLYDASGVDISAGVKGEAEGEAKVTTNKKLNGYAGSLDLKISPMIKGNLVVDIPIFDKKLKDHPLFEVEMKPFWSEKWESSSNWKEDLKWTESEESVQEVSTYTTKLTEVDGTAVPIFSFDYPKNWEIAYEEVSGNEIEMVEVVNENGIVIEYTYMVGSKYFGDPRYTVDVDISKITDSKFVSGYAVTNNYSHLGEFAVVEVKTDSETYYAVKPLSECDKNSVDGNFVNGFWYDGLLVFSVEMPEEITQKEMQEIMDILSSFRVSDKVNISQTFSDLRNGDFSEFAGTYKALGIYEEKYGGGDSISDLVLDENGIVTGGGSWFETNPYPQVAPSLVTKNEDGSYKCQVMYEDENNQAYFLIYPEGTIGENPYIYNDPFLTEHVYIQYMVIDGGVGDIIYYKVDE